VGCIVDLAAIDMPAPGHSNSAASCLTKPPYCPNLLVPHPRPRQHTSLQTCYVMLGPPGFSLVFIHNGCAVHCGQVGPQYELPEFVLWANLATTLSTPIMYEDENAAWAQHGPCTQCLLLTCRGPQHHICVFLGSKYTPHTHTPLSPPPPPPPPPGVPTCW